MLIHCILSGSRLMCLSYICLIKLSIFSLLILPDIHRSSFIIPGVNQNLEVLIFREVPQFENHGYIEKFKFS